MKFSMQQCFKDICTQLHAMLPSFCICNDKIFLFVAFFHLSVDNDLGHLITKTETLVVYTFSVRDHSRKQNVTLQLIPSLVGFEVGLYLSDSL